MVLLSFDSTSKQFLTFLCSKCLERAPLFGNWFQLPPKQKVESIVFHFEEIFSLNLLLPVLPDKAKFCQISNILKKWFAVLLAIEVILNLLSSK